MKSLVSSRAPGPAAGGGALCVGGEDDDPPCSESSTSMGLRPRNQLMATTAMKPMPPSLRPPPKAGPEASRSSRLPLLRMFPHRIVSPLLERVGIEEPESSVASPVPASR